MTHHKLILRLFAAAFLASTVAGCQQRVTGGNSDASAVTAAIKADEKQWNADFKARNAEALIGHYADGAYLIAPGAPAADGMTDIRKIFAAALSDRNFQLSFASDKVDVSTSGDLAYSRGHFSEKFTDPKSGKTMSDSGSYLTIYKKQQDGGWKAVEDFVVADPASRKEVKPEPPATRAKMVSFG
jgi:uncharacterized protein (TIGR02246 family)